MRNTVWILILLLLCVPALAEDAAGAQETGETQVEEATQGIWLLRDGVSWGMDAESLWATLAEGETAEKLSEQMIRIDGTVFGDAEPDLFVSMKDGCVYMLSYDMLSEEPDALFEHWLTLLTGKYGEPTEEQEIAVATVITADANMTGDELDFDTVLAGIGSASVWCPEEHTLIAMFLYEEDEICVFAADERVIYDMDENGRIKEFGQ